MATVSIRPARLDELAELSALAWAAKGHWGYPPEMMERWRDELTFTADTLERFRVVVAIVEQSIAGALAWSSAGAVFEIEHFWVRPERMGHGVGRALYEHADRAARELGAARIEVVSDPNAEGFYRQMGMRRIAEIASTPPGRMIPRLGIDL